MKWMIGIPSVPIVHGKESRELQLGRASEKFIRVPPYPEPFIMECKV